MVLLEDFGRFDLPEPRLPKAISLAGHIFVVEASLFALIGVVPQTALST
jgi:hypothetical protein